MYCIMTGAISKNFEPVMGFWNVKYYSYLWWKPFIERRFLYELVNNMLCSSSLSVTICI